MKTLSRLALVIMAIASLAACQQSGEGPSKPASSSFSQAAQ